MERPVEVCTELEKCGLPRAPGGRFHALNQGFGGPLSRQNTRTSQITWNQNVDQHFAGDELQKMGRSLTPYVALLRKLRYPVGDTEDAMSQVRAARSAHRDAAGSASSTV